MISDAIAGSMRTFHCPKRSARCASVLMASLAATEPVPARPMPSATTAAYACSSKSLGRSTLARLVSSVS